MALGFCPVFVILGKYFDKYRGTANGLMLSGSCLGSIVFPHLIKYFLDEYGLRGALLMTAAVYAHVIVFSCLLRPDSYYTRQRHRQSIVVEVTEPLMKKQFPHNNNKTNHQANNERKTELKVQNPNPNINRDFENGRARNVDESVNVGSNYKMHQQFTLNHQNNEGSEAMTSSLPDVNKRDNSEARLRARTLSGGKDDTFYFRGLGGRRHLSSHSVIMSSSMADITWSNTEVYVEAEIIEITNTRRKICDLSVMRKLEYDLYLVYYSLCSIAGATYFVFIPAFADDKGLTSQEIVVMLNIHAVADLVGRVTCGYIADRPKVRMPHIILVAHSVMAVVCNCARFLDAYWTFYIFVIPYGLFSGMQFALCGNLVSRIVGLKQFPTAFGISVLFHQMSVGAVSPLLG